MESVTNLTISLSDIQTAREGADGAKPDELQWLQETAQPSGGGLSPLSCFRL